MIRYVFAIVLSVASFSQAALSEKSNVDEILQALEARGQELHDFTANVTLTSTDLNTMDAPVRDGKVWFQSQPSGDTRIRVTFDKLTVDGKPGRADKTEYLLEKEWLIDRNYNKKQEIKRQIQRPGEKTNLLKLGEGPFPLPIGQPPADVRKQFEVQQVDPKQDVEGDPPPNTLRLQLTPHEGTRIANKFSRIDVWVDVSNSMPRRIEVTDRNETMIQTTDLLDLKLNKGIDDADFELSKIGDDWHTATETFDDE